MVKLSTPAAASCIAVLLLAAASAATAARTSPRQLLQDSDLQQQCIDAFNAYGGTQGIAPRVPSCNQNSFNFANCCSETKAALSLGPQGCLCNANVWAEVERQMTSAGIQGLNANTLRTFTNACQIPNHGAGTC